MGHPLKSKQRSRICVTFYKQEYVLELKYIAAIRRGHTIYEILTLDDLLQSKLKFYLLFHSRDLLSFFDFL